METEIRKISLGNIGFETNEPMWTLFEGYFLLPKSQPPSPFELEAYKIVMKLCEKFNILDEENKPKIEAAFFSSLFGSGLDTVWKLVKQTIFSIFLFVLDDQLDTRYVKIDIELLYYAFRIFYNIFDGSIKSLKEIQDKPQNAFNGFKFEPLCKTAFWIRRIIFDRIKQDKSFFLNSLSKYLDATIWGCKGGFRKSGKYTRFSPSFRSYIFMRERTGACMPAIELLILLSGCKFTKEQHEDPNVELALQLINDHICLFNDFVSFFKECGISESKSEDNGENLIAIKTMEYVKRKKEKPFEKGLKFTINSMNETVDQIAKIFLLLSNEEKNLIIVGIYCLIDNVRWSLASKRYRLTVNENCVIKQSKF